MGLINEKGARVGVGVGVARDLLRDIMMEKRQSGEAGIIH